MKQKFILILLIFHTSFAFWGCSSSTILRLEYYKHPVYFGNKITQKLNSSILIKNYYATKFEAQHIYNYEERGNDMLYHYVDIPKFGHFIPTEKGCWRLAPEQIKEKNDNIIVIKNLVRSGEDFCISGCVISKNLEEVTNK